MGPDGRPIQQQQQQSQQRNTDPHNQFLDYLRMFENSSGNLVTRMGTVFVWCAIYVYSTYAFMERDSPDEEWDVQAQPNWLREFEIVLLWIVTLEFLLGFVVADSKRGYLTEIR